MVIRNLILAILVHFRKAKYYNFQVWHLVEIAGDDQHQTPHARYSDAIWYSQQSRGSVFLSGAPRETLVCAGNEFRGVWVLKLTR